MIKRGLTESLTISHAQQLRYIAGTARSVDAGMAAADKIDDDIKPVPTPPPFPLAV